MCLPVLVQQVLVPGEDGDAPGVASLLGTASDGRSSKPNALGDTWSWCRSSSIGRRVFSTLFMLVTPYAATVRPLFQVIDAHRCELVVRNRRRVRNHLGSVHATALCTGIECAVGALAEVTVPDGKRWIPTGMEVSYTGRADGDIRCVALTTQSVWDSDESEVTVHVYGERRDGAIVIQGSVTLRVTDRR